MFKKTRYFFYIVALIVILHVYPYGIAMAAGECSDIKTMYKLIFETLRIPAESWRIDTKGRVIMYFHDPRDGRWLELGISPDADIACVLNNGNDSGPMNGWTI